MSQENVAIVRLVTLEGDVAEVIREDALWAAWVERVAPYFDPECMGSIQTGVGMGGRGDICGPRWLEGHRARLDGRDDELPSRNREDHRSRRQGAGTRSRICARPGSDAEMQISPGQVFEFAHGKIIAARASLTAALAASTASS